MERKAGAKTSLLVSNGALLFLLLLAPAAAAFGYAVLAALSLCLAALGAMSRLLSARAMAGLAASVESGAAGLFPGETLRVGVRLENRGVLPLRWAELSLPVARGAALLPKALIADPELLRSCVERGELDRRFSHLAPREKLRWSAEWQGMHRGIVRFTDFRVRSGDPFGLYPQERSEAGTGGEIAVYPHLQGVRTELFYEPNWAADSGSRGYLEDVSLLRGSRAYQSGDRARHINWRMTARSDTLTLNLFERIRPLSALFLFDGESFNALPFDERDLEDALSVLASLFTALLPTGVFCSLALPKDADSPPRLLRAAPLPALLRALAAYRAEPLTPPQTPNEPVQRRPSVYSGQLVSAAAEAGRVYCLCASLERLCCGAALETLERSGQRVTLIPSRPGGERAFSGGRVVPLAALKRGDA